MLDIHLSCNNISLKGSVSLNVEYKQDVNIPFEFGFFYSLCSCRAFTGHYIVITTQRGRTYWGFISPVSLLKKWTFQYDIGEDSYTHKRVQYDGTHNVVLYQDVTNITIILHLVWILHTIVCYSSKVVAMSVEGRIFQYDLVSTMADDALVPCVVMTCIIFESINQWNYKCIQCLLKIIRQK